MNKILLIVNPVSGNKNSTKILPNIKSILKKEFDLTDIIKTEYPNHIEEIVLNYNFDSLHCICIIGGDGSFHEAINGMLNRKDQKKIPLALIPSGSGNSLCRDLDLLDPLKATKNIINQNKMKIDILKITDYNQNIIYSFNIVGWGMVTDIGIKAEKYRWLGTGRYTILSLLEIILKKTNNAHIMYYDKNNKKHNLENKFIFAVICNTIHTGKGMKIAPRAKLNDGLMDLVLIKDVPRLKLLKLMPKLFTGEHINDNAVKYIHVSKLELKPNIISKLNIDGEIKGKTPFELTVIPDKIEIIH